MQDSLPRRESRSQYFSRRARLFHAHGFGGCFLLRVLFGGPFFRRHEPDVDDSSVELCKVNGGSPLYTFQEDSRMACLIQLAHLPAIPGRWTASR